MSVQRKEMDSVFGLEDSRICSSLELRIFLQQMVRRMVELVRLLASQNQLIISPREDQQFFAKKSLT